MAARTTDFSSFEVDAIQPPVEDTQAPEAESTTLTNETEIQPSQEKEDRSNSTEEEAKQTETSQDEQNKIPDINNKQETVSKRPDTNAKETPKSVPYNRFSEVTKEKNEWKTKYEEAVKKQSAQPQGEQKPDYAVPPPYDKKPELYKSNFSEEQLEGVLTSQADAETKELARLELNKLRDSERRVTRWESWEVRNQQAYQQKQAQEVHFTNEAVKLVPDLNNADSPAFKEFSKIMSRVNKIDSNFMKQPEARYLIAQSVNDRLKSARMDTVLEENKKLKDEVQNLRKARQPLVASSAPVLGEASADAKPQSVSSFADKIRAAGVNRG